ncbi:hypothetical protein EMUR_00465 [Ehrlichia muris AS145]|uniref:Uncharacterized protein n=2 Tax=Ehrlichia muris TaxID=35795 RepID=V9R8P1_9RICK|nr:hypothetical protein EMUR_00465 [Ehrlichia muris AS145]
MAFSIALIVAVPSLILLCFLIYKMCKGQNLTNQLVGDTDLLMNSAMEVCQFLQDELNTNKQKINLMISSYECLEHKYSVLAHQCSAGLDNLNAELTRLDVLLSQTTVTTDNRLIVLQNMVADIKQKMLQISVCHSSVREMENRLVKCISNSLQASNITLQNKIELLKELRIDLSSPLSSLDGLKCSIQVIINCIESDVPEQSLFLKFNKLYSCMRKLRTSLLSVLLNVDILQVDTGAALSLVQQLDELFTIFNKQIKYHTGNDAKKLQDIHLHAQLLQIRLLRFLVQQRSTMLTDACDSTTKFIASCSTEEEMRVPANVEETAIPGTVVAAGLFNISDDSAIVDVGVAGLSSVDTDSKGAIGSAHP